MVVRREGCDGGMHWGNTIRFLLSDGSEQSVSMMWRRAIEWLSYGVMATRLKFVFRPLDTPLKAH